MTEQTMALPPIPPETDINAFKSRKSNYFKLKVDGKLLKAQGVLYGLKNNPTIKRIMAPMGYTNEKVGEFTAVYQAASSAHFRQHKEYADKMGAYDIFEHHFVSLKEQLVYLTKVAKIVFRNDDVILCALKLNSKRDRTIAGILLFIGNFLNHAMNDQKIKQQLAKHGYDADKIRSFYNLYQLANDAYSSLNREHGEALEATKNRDSKIAVLDEWMYEYYSFEKVAFAQNPGWLEELEIGSVSDMMIDRGEVNQQ